MSVRIKLGAGYQEYAGNAETVEVEGTTIRECLKALITLFPVFDGLLYGSEYPLSALIIHNGELILSDRLDRSLADIDEFSLLPMVYGG